MADIGDGAHPPARLKPGRLRRIALAALIVIAVYGLLGQYKVLRLVEACKKRDGPAVTIPSPPATKLKDQIWATGALGK